MRAPSGRGRSQALGRGFGRGRSQFTDVIPDIIEEVGELLHTCEGELVCNLTHKKVPYFNGSIFLQNKVIIGKVEEIFGPINAVKFTVKLADGVLASSYKSGDKFYIGTDKLLPMERFTSPKSTGGNAGRGVGRGGRGGRGRGSTSGGRMGLTTARGRGRGRGGRFSGRG